MKTFLLSLSTLLFCLCPALGADLNADRDFDFAKKGPFEFIAHLIRQEERGVKRILVPDAPEGWIQERHLGLLVLLLDSDEPCASVGSMRSSRLPTKEDSRTSTVGHEAAYLIESYRHGLFPKYAVNTSAGVNLDRAEMKRWWSALQKREDDQESGSGEKVRPE